MTRGQFLLAALVAVSSPAAAQQDLLAPDIVGPEDVQPAVPEAPALPSRTIPLPQAEGPPALSAVLTVDQDALYLQSAWGLRAQERLEAAGEQIAAENERLTELLSGEEAGLTNQRATLAPAEFRRLAEAFDLRATEIRRERAQAVQALNTWADADRNAFFRAALPVMGDVMEQRGAAAVLDRRTVFVSLEGIDITRSLIDTLDATIGDGEGAVPMPDIGSPHLEPAGAADGTAD